MSTYQRLLNRVRSLVGGKSDFYDALLPEDVQRVVATEEALDAAVETIVFMIEMWNGLLTQLAAEGTMIILPQPVEQRHADNMARLTAALKVISETLGIDLELMKGQLDG